VEVLLEWLLWIVVFLAKNDPELYYGWWF